MSVGVFRVPTVIAGTPVLRLLMNAFSASDPRVIDLLVTPSITESRMTEVVSGIWSVGPFRSGSRFVHDLAESEIWWNMRSITDG